jgi:hypothetical protein
MFTGPNIVSIIVTLGFCGTTFMFFFWPPAMSDAGWTALSILLGALAVQFANVVMYQIGSTRSSKEKDETIKSLSKNQ